MLHASTLGRLSGGRQGRKVGEGKEDDIVTISVEDVTLPGEIP